MGSSASNYFYEHILAKICGATRNTTPPASPRVKNISNISKIKSILSKLSKKPPIKPATENKNTDTYSIDSDDEYVTFIPTNMTNVVGRNNQPNKITYVV